MLVSIQLNSNRPESIAALISNIEETANNPAEIEVIFHIDLGDEECRDILEKLKTTSKVKIKYLETDIIKHYKDLWKPLNEVIKLTDPNAYFVTNFSDEFRFRTKGWDDIIKKYIDYYEDGIFRIRLSRYRYRNYNDFWECVFAPDSLAFYTKKWMDIVEIWCPCLGPDSWQQLVSCYLTNSQKFDHIQYNRDIAEPFIEFSGEGASLGLKGDKAKQRIKDNLDLWFETVSHEMQEKAKRAAALLQAHILCFQNKNKNSLSANFVSNRKPGAFQNQNQISFRENHQKKIIEFYNQDKRIYKISYKMNKFFISALNSLRKIKYFYYAGGGNEVGKKDLVSQINMFVRYKLHGKIGGNSNITLRKPLYFKDSLVLNFLWPIFKILILFTWILVTVTRTEKYYRFIKFKINRHIRFWHGLQKKTGKKTYPLFWPVIKVKNFIFRKQ